jgi:hypothetical protein
MKKEITVNSSDDKSINLCHYILGIDHFKVVVAGRSFDSRKNRKKWIDCEKDKF